MREIIRFTAQEIKGIEEFAEMIKWKHPHFKDRRNTAKRTPEQIKNDVILGKLAEVGVQKYLRKHYGNCVSNVDFAIYDKWTGDDYDIKVNDKIITIKSSKIISSCLLFETAKFQLDDEGNWLTLEKNPIPDYFMFVRVDLRNPLNIYAEITGAMSAQEFWKRKKFLPRGFFMNKNNAISFLLLGKPLSSLPSEGRGSKLLADNYGIHIDELHTFTDIFQAYKRPAQV